MNKPLPLRYTPKAALSQLIFRIYQDRRIQQARAGVPESEREQMPDEFKLKPGEVFDDTDEEEEEEVADDSDIDFIIKDMSPNRSKRRRMARLPTEEEAAELLRIKYYLPEAYPATGPIRLNSQMQVVRHFFDPNEIRNPRETRAYLKEYFDLTEDQAERLRFGMGFYQ
jgi:hypothetical protein